MKAFIVSNPGAQPTIAEVPTPAAGAGQVLVRVTASSVNALDAGIAIGALEQAGFPHEYPVTLGRDVAGTVEALGDGVAMLTVGDRVFGEIPLVPPVSAGTWAEFAVLDAANLTRTPDGVDDSTVGAATLAVVTALQVVDALELTAGETVLIIGATGGVGSVVAQLAKRAGATVLAPALPEDAPFLTGLGVDEVIEREGDVVAVVRGRYPDGVDAIVDVVTAYQPTTYEAALKRGGRVASPTNAAGEGAGRTNVMHDPAPELLSRVAELLADGSVTVSIQRTFGLADLADALQSFSADHTVGKIAVDIS